MNQQAHKFLEHILLVKNWEVDDLVSFAIAVVKKPVTVMRIVQVMLMHMVLQYYQVS